MNTVRDNFLKETVSVLVNKILFKVRDKYRELIIKILIWIIFSEKSFHFQITMILYQASMLSNGLIKKNNSLNNLIYKTANNMLTNMNR